jgi:hypothetical protein
MSERPTPKRLEPSDEVEILPPDPSDGRFATGESPFWISFDARGRGRRVYVANPGPFGTILLVVGLGFLLAVSFVVLVGVLALLVFIACVFIAGLLVRGLFRKYSWRRR